MKVWYSIYALQWEEEKEEGTWSEQRNIHLYMSMEHSIVIHTYIQERRKLFRWQTVSFISNKVDIRMCNVNKEIHTYIRTNTEKYTIMRWTCIIKTDALSYDTFCHTNYLKSFIVPHYYFYYKYVYKCAWIKTFWFVPFLHNVRMKGRDCMPKLLRLRSENHVFGLLKIEKRVIHNDFI